MRLLVTPSPSECIYPHCFNLVTSATRLGTFAGVLTALTFSTIIFLTGRERKDHPQVENTLILFIAAFVSMAISTYLFTSASSEEGTPGGRVAFETFCASLAFSTALLPLFLGIVQLMRDREFRRVVWFASRLVNWIVGVVIFVFMSLTAIASRGVDKSVAGAWHSNVTLACGVLALALVIWISLGSKIPQFNGRKAIDTWTAYTVIVVVIALVLTAIWGEVKPTEAMPTLGYIALMFLLFVAILGYSTVLKGLEQYGPLPNEPPASATDHSRSPTAS
jgi:hypothetical protein